VQKIYPLNQQQLVLKERQLGMQFPAAQHCSARGCFALLWQKANSKPSRANGDPFLRHACPAHPTISTDYITANSNC
jgi:hypothetical protein